MTKELYKRAIIIRKFEEKLLDLFSRGKLSGTVHTCIGQELTGLAVANSLVQGDWIYSNHRCHGHYLAWTGDVQGLMAEIMGLPSGICAGRGGSQHIYRDQFLSNGVQGGGVPIAAGCALAFKDAGPSGPIAVAYIGDGTLGQGVVYETLNIVSKWQIPLLIVLERNGYAQSTATGTTIAGDVRARFEAFGLKYWEAAIWETDKLLTVAAEAIGYVRGQRAPAALCIPCYRLKAHSKGDDNRELSEISEFEQKDPLRVFEREQPEAAKAIQIECDAVIAAALEAIEKEPGTAVGTRPAAGPTVLPEVSPTWRAVPALPTPQRTVERIRAGLRDLLTAHKAVMVLGEDLEDPYGGAFKATKGLSTEFPGRVRNTPISEAAIVGLANGLALAGVRPFVEIMFGDFATLAADQIINQASKFAYIYNEQIKVPVVVRAAMGGRRGYGATHSQSLERHFFGTPGLVILALNAIFDPAVVFQRLHASLPEPCLVVENKLLYSVPMRQTAADGRPWLENGATFPTLKLDGGGRADVTVVAYGGMVEEVEAAVKRAFLEEEMLAEVLVPTLLQPLDLGPILASVAQTGRLLVAEEGQGFAGFGAEVIAACMERAGAARPATARVYAAPHPIPCSKTLELRSLPDANQIVQAIVKLVKS